MRGAPERLRQRMRSALEQRASVAASSAVAAGVEANASEQLAEAALLCLQSVLEHPAERDSALDLLAADALLTHACELASERNELPSLVTRLSHARFAQLLSQDQP